MDAPVILYPVLQLGQPLPPVLVVSARPTHLAPVLSHTLNVLLFPHDYSAVASVSYFTQPLSSNNSPADMLLFSTTDLKD